MPEKVVLGLSGGVDSACAALMLKERGCEVVGVFLAMTKDRGASEKARALASRLGIGFCAVDAADRFAQSVLLPFAEGYAGGLTPNPCVLCNSRVKFPLLLRTAEELGADSVATGHYTVPVCVNGRYSLAPAKDVKKDQGYFLCRLPQSALSRFTAPLGGFFKSDVKRLAADNGLFPGTGVRESRDLCFARKGGYAEVVASYAAPPPSGDFIDERGKVLGRHRGIHNYTVGQRKGLRIALGAPAYVSAIDPLKNTVTLATGAFPAAGAFKVSHLNFLSAPEIKGGQRFKVRTRYGAKPLDCIVEKTVGDFADVTFCRESCIAAPGQAAVFYDENGLIAFAGLISR